MPTLRHFPWCVPGWLGCATALLPPHSFCHSRHSPCSVLGNLGAQKLLLSGWEHPSCPTCPKLRTRLEQQWEIFLPSPGIPVWVGDQSSCTQLSGKGSTPGLHLGECHGSGMVCPQSHQAYGEQVLTGLLQCPGPWPSLVLWQGTTLPEPCQWVASQNQQRLPGLWFGHWHRKGCTAACSCLLLSAASAESYCAHQGQGPLSQPCSAPGWGSQVSFHWWARHGRLKLRQNCLGGQVLSLHLLLSSKMGREINITAARNVGLVSGEQPP